MNSNVTTDKDFDDLLYYAVPLAAKELMDEMELPEKEPEFSKEHDAKMQKLFRRERNKLLINKISVYSKRVAIVLFITLVVAGLSLLSVEAWRIKVLNFVMEIKQTHSEINLSEEKTGDTYNSDQVSFEYIPKGFKLENSDLKENRIYLLFKNDDQFFEFIMIRADGQMGIDTEQAQVKKININGNEAIYSTNNNINVLLWHDSNYVYSLEGNIIENELVNIAKNIKKL